MTDERMNDNEFPDEPYGLTGLEISVNAILADLTLLDHLRTKQEQNKQDLVGQEGPVSDEDFDKWLFANCGKDEGHTRSVDFEDHSQLHPWLDTSFELPEAENVLRERLSSWHQKIIVDVMHLFPSLREIACSDPFLNDEFSTWIRDHDDPQAIHAGRFILSIWERDPDLFNLTDAFLAWDNEHRQAYVQWLKSPVMPHRELWGTI